MLVTFTCKAHGDVMMFGDVAKRLLKMMGLSGAIPSAINAEDIPEALALLQKAIEAQQGTSEEQSNPNDDDKPEEPPISIAVRAFPLIEMLQSAVEEECAVMWRGT